MLLMRWVIILIVVGLLATCGSLKKMKKDEDEAQQNSDDGITMVGTLAIGETALRFSGMATSAAPAWSFGKAQGRRPELTQMVNEDAERRCNEAAGLRVSGASTMTIRCETYKEPRMTCTIPVDVSGQFSTLCKGIAAQPFGCVLKEGETVVSDFVFDGQANVLGGSGNVNVAVNVDSAVGTVTSTIDKTKSTALESSALTKSGASAKASTAWTTSIAGSWKVACITTGDDVAAFDGADTCPDKTSFYLAAVGAEQFSVWGSQETYQACTATVGSTSYTEAAPHWQVKVSGDSAKSVTFDFTDVPTLEATLDDVFAALPTAIQTSITTTADDLHASAAIFKPQLEALRSAVSDKFRGVVVFRVPTAIELRRRLVINLLYLKSGEVTNDFCATLRIDETFPSYYRRIHSIVPELLCQFKDDGIVTDVKTFLSTTQPASCLPKIFFDVVYNSASKAEELVLRCPGSSAAEGACFDANKNFVGDIAGRFNVMQLNNRVDGVFDLFQSRDLELAVIHPKDGLKTCKIANRSMIKGLKTSDDLFTATFEDHFVDRCQSSGASQQSRDFYGNRTDAQVQRYSKMWKATFTRQ